MTGVIRRVVLEKGFGFIEPENGGPQFFYHRSVVAGIGFDELRVGQRVECDVVSSDKGPRAEFVRPILDC